MLNALLSLTLLSIPIASAEDYTGLSETSLRWLQDRGHTALQPQEGLSVGAFVGNGTSVYSLGELPSQGALPQDADHPWSEVFWANRLGSIDFAAFIPGQSLGAAHYFFPALFEESVHTSHRRWREQALASGNTRRRGTHENPLSLLSPAEKLDLLMGDTDFTFTHQVHEWLRGARARGEDALWSGLCDGWAAAAVSYRRPELTVVVEGAHGHLIPFFPSDIKALATWAWAHSSPSAPARVIGARCGTRHRPAQPEDPACRDLNPAILHISLATLIGTQARPFIVDDDAGSPVMNHPIVAYEFQYPQGRIGRHLDPTSPRAEYHSRRAFRTVEVEAHVRMQDYHGLPGGAQGPAHRDSLARDHFLARTWRYELEVDSRGRIVGAEWLSAEHPDFAWMPEPGALPINPLETEPQTTWDPLRNPPPFSVLQMHEGLKQSTPAGQAPIFPEVTVRSLLMAARWDRTPLQRR